MLPSKNPYNLTCRGCNIQFSCWNRRVLYCQTACKKKHYYKLWLAGELSVTEAEYEHHWISEFKKRKEEDDLKKKKKSKKIQKNS